MSKQENITLDDFVPRDFGPGTPKVIPYFGKLAGSDLISSSFEKGMILLPTAIALDSGWETRCAPLEISFG